MAEYIFKEAERSSYLTVDTNEIITTLEKKERITRCRDCKYSKEFGSLCSYRKPYYLPVSHDGFCSWGEPK